MKNKLFFTAIALPLIANAMMVGCSDCDSTTVVADFPAFAGAGLNKQTTRNRGGLTGKAILKCSDPLADVSVQLNWQNAIDAGDMIIRKDCGYKAGKTSEAETEDVGACGTTVVTGRTHTIAVEDTFDNSDNNTCEMYLHFQANPSDYLVAMIYCDGRILPFQKMDIIIDKQIEDTNKGKTFWAGNMTYDKLVDDCPITLPFDIDDLTF